MSLKVSTVIKIVTSLRFCDDKCQSLKTVQRNKVVRSLIHKLHEIFFAGTAHLNFYRLSKISI